MAGSKEESMKEGLRTTLNTASRAARSFRRAGRSVRFAKKIKKGELYETQSKT
jgi:hypothetical protein